MFGIQRQNSDLFELLVPVVHALGYEMLGIIYHKQQGASMLRLYIACDAGITVGDCAKVSDQVTGVLDIHNPIKEQYYLEVSSPGLNRPLFTLQQLQQFLGHTVKLKLRQKVSQRRKFVGLIKLIEGTNITINDTDNDYIIPADAIESANLVAEL